MYHCLPTLSYAQLKSHEYSRPRQLRNEILCILVTIFLKPKNFMHCSLVKVMVLGSLCDAYTKKRESSLYNYYVLCWTTLCHENLSISVTKSSPLPPPPLANFSN